MTKNTKQRPLALAMSALLVASLLSAFSSRSALSQDTSSRITLPDNIEKTIASCRELTAAGAADVSALSNELLRVSPEGNIELLFHAMSRTGLAEEQDLETLGANIVTRLEPSSLPGFPQTGLIQAWVPFEAVVQAAALPWVVAVTAPDYGDSNTHPVNAIDSEGVALHQADAAQSQGFDGTGVNVGALSDGVDNLAVAQAANERFCQISRQVEFCEAWR